MPASPKTTCSANKTPLAALTFLATLAACAPEAADDLPPVAVVVTENTGCGKNGALKTQLFGSIETRIDWSGSDLRCDSMPRPDDEGIRLHFAGDVANERFALIVALPALKRGELRAELPSIVTATVEGSGRFFSTHDLDTCWTDVKTLAPLPDEEDAFAMSGILYCMAPLGEVNGDAAVSIPELSFTTVINWKTS